MFSVVSLFDIDDCLSQSVQYCDSMRFPFIRMKKQNRRAIIKVTTGVSIQADRSLTIVVHHTSLTKCRK